MTLFASGHEDTGQDWPGPLQRNGWDTLGAVALPVVLLSAASIVVFLTVFGFLQRSAELRSLFSLEAGGSRGFPAAVATLTAALASTIAGRCRHRPGPLWPRVWVLLLAGLASLLLPLLLIDPWPAARPLLDALTLAALAAGLTLAPRLLRLHPDSPWVQRIAPVSLGLVLLLILPVAYLLGSDTVDNRLRRVQAKIAEIDRQTARLRDCGEAPCPAARYRAALELLDRVAATPVLRDAAVALEDQYQLGTRLNQSVTALADRLAPTVATDFAQRLGAPWPTGPEARAGRLRGIEELNLDALALLLRVGPAEPARQALDRTAAAIVGAGGPPGTPSLAAAPVTYGPGDGPYPLNPDFPRAAADLVGYYRQSDRLYAELNRLLAELPEADGGSDREAWPREWDRRTAALATSWADHWILAFLDRDGARQPAPPELAELLALPVLGDLAAANLRGLTGLTKSRAEELLARGQAAHCEAVRGTRDGAQAPYRFSLRCRSYGAGATPEATTLRVELRLIYEDNRPLGGNSRPERLYFILPVPAGADPESHLARVTEALATARARVRDPAPTEALPRCTQLAVPRSCIDLAPFAPEQQYVKIVVYRQ